MSAEEPRSGRDDTPAGSENPPGTENQNTESQHAGIENSGVQDNAGPAGEFNLPVQRDQGLGAAGQAAFESGHDGDFSDEVRRQKVDAVAEVKAVPSDLPAIPGQNSDLMDAGAALEAGSTEVISVAGRGESQRALSVASARGFRLKMLRWRRQLAQ